MKPANLYWDILIQTKISSWIAVTQEIQTISVKKDKKYKLHSRECKYSNIMFHQLVFHGWVKVCLQPPERPNVLFVKIVNRVLSWFYWFHLVPRRQQNTGTKEMRYITSCFHLDTWKTVCGQHLTEEYKDCHLHMSKFVTRLWLWFPQYLYLRAAEVHQQYAGWLSFQMADSAATKQRFLSCIMPESQSLPPHCINFLLLWIPFVFKSVTCLFFTN